MKSLVWVFSLLDAWLEYRSNLNLKSFITQTDSNLRQTEPTSDPLQHTTATLCSFCLELWDIWHQLTHDPLTTSSMPQNKTTISKTPRQWQLPLWCCPFPRQLLWQPDTLSHEADPPWERLAGNSFCQNVGCVAHPAKQRVKTQDEGTARSSHQRIPKAAHPSIQESFQTALTRIIDQLLHISNQSYDLTTFPCSRLVFSLSRLEMRGRHPLVPGCTTQTFKAPQAIYSYSSFNN